MIAYNAYEFVGSLAQVLAEQIRIAVLGDYVVDVRSSRHHAGTYSSIFPIGLILNANQLMVIRQIPCLMKGEIFDSPFFVLDGNAVDKKI